MTNLSETNIKNFDLNKSYNLFEINAKQGDTDGARGILFKVINDSIPFLLNGLKLQVGGSKPDGKSFLNTVEVIDEKNSVIKINLTKEMLAVAGVLKAELIIIKGDIKLSSYPFTINIIPNTTNFNAITSDDDFGVLIEALTKVEGYNKELQEAVNSGKEDVYMNVKNDFEPLRKEINKSIIIGNDEISSLEELKKQYLSKLDDINNNNLLEVLKTKIDNLSEKQNSDITWTNGNVTNNANELEKFTYSKINTFNCEKSKTGVIKIWGYKAVSSSEKGVWITVQLPFELPNKNYVVNLTVVDGKVDSSFRRIKLGNNQSRTSFDIFIDWAVGFNFEVICSP